MSTTPKDSSRPSTPQPRSSLSITATPSRTYSHAHAHPLSPQHHYHSAPLPQSPSQLTFGPPPSSPQQPTTAHRSSTPVQSALSRAVSFSNVLSTAQGTAADTTTTTPTAIASATTTAIGGAPATLPSSLPPFPPTQSSPRNSGGSNGSSSAMADHRTQFNTSEIERSFQALLKKQPVATPGPAVFHGRGHRHLHSKEVKPRQYLSPHHHSHRSGSESNGHSPVFGSPAADHARHWIKSVGQVQDQTSDSEGDGHHAESDQDSAEDAQQQWQIDYDHHIAGHVELESDDNDRAARPPLKLQDHGKGKGQGQGQGQEEPPLSPSASLWTGTVHPMFSMADPMGNKDQGIYPGLVSPPVARPTVRIKERAVHPLSPAPHSPNSGSSTPRVSLSRSPEIRPQLMVHSGDLSTLVDLGSMLPIAPNTVNLPLPPLPAPPPRSEGRVPRPKHGRIPAPPNPRMPRGSLLTVDPLAKEKQPVSLTNPPRKCVHHGKILQVINTSTVKDRYLFLFSDLLLIAKPMSDGHPTIESRFQVKDVIELKKISLSLSRDKEDAKSGNTGNAGGRKIPPALAEFIHTFDQNPTRALNTFIQKRALHPDPVSVAYLLFKTPELSKSQLALFLATPANRHVYRSFLDQCQFAGVLLDEALRILLGRVSLPERMAAQQRSGSSDKSVNVVDYILDEFTKRWYEANVNVVVFDASIAHKLVIAMLVLNAQLHNNEGASLVKDREEVGTLVRPRIGSQPSTPTIPSTPVMDSNLSAPASSAQQYLTMELDDLTAFPTPTKESFVEMFQLLDQQRIVPKDTLLNIYSSICHQPLDIDLDKPSTNVDGAHPSSVPAAMRKLWPIMMSPSPLPPRLTLKIPSDPITITVPVMNPAFSIHLGGRDLKCEPSVLEFGSHRSQRFRITGSVPGRKTLTIQPRLSTEKAGAGALPEHFYDLQTLPTKHTIAIERQFMRHTFQISLLNDLGTRRRYLFGTSSAAEKDEWARVLTECLLVAKGQNADRLNEHTGLEQSIGLQILKELLLGVEASDEDEVAVASSTKGANGPTDALSSLPLPVTPTTIGGIGLGIPLENGVGGTGALAGKGSVRDSHISLGPNAATLGAGSPTLGSGAGAEWATAGNHIVAAAVKDAWMCKMPTPGSAIPDRHGWELVKLVEQNSLMALMLGFMGALGRDRLRRIEAMRRANEDNESLVDSYEDDDDDDDDIDLEGEYTEDDHDGEYTAEEYSYDEDEKGYGDSRDDKFSRRSLPLMSTDFETAVPMVQLTAPTPVEGTLDPSKPQQEQPPHVIEVMLETEEQLVRGQEDGNSELVQVETKGVAGTTAVAPAISVSGIAPDDLDEEGVIGSVSGRVHKVRGKEIWWTQS
ncbi:hypothetical protein EMPS_04331 [Entomortierella parvispora]|uniref:SEC7 domain-containing protein n=1 Tax=Entomortierella parvispora TaxID=205924 RepID=A0A9P3H8D2_9FUNG|nr:hypothetical protein EMPS_04331 [Entomortierella parvispora]